MTRVGFVLGAGGAGGWPFHLGVVEAARDAFGHDAATAELVVGTSSGAIVGGALTNGASIEDFLIATTVEPTAEDKAAMSAAYQAEKVTGLRRFAPLSLSLAGRGISGRTPGLFLAGVLPAGPTPTAYLGSVPSLAHAPVWPANLWVPAVRVVDSELVVFGRDCTDVPMMDAIEASVAVPGVFRPKRIGKHRYIDGATRSATNLDLLADRNLDVVIVSSIMTRPGRRPSRIIARRRLPIEIAAVERSGTRVIVVEPDKATTAMFPGFPRTGPDVAKRIHSAAYELATAAFS
ncbi:MAG: NTE family protein [Candidatus Poriferisodalaceae bacterium]|jgi:NTE family protein